MSADTHNLKRPRKISKHPNVFNKLRFRKALKYIAKHKGLTFTEFTETLKPIVSLNTLHKWIYNTHIPNPPILKKVCDEIGLRWESFLYNSDSFNPNLDIKDIDIDLDYHVLTTQNFPNTILNLIKFLQRKLPIFKVIGIFPNPEESVILINNINLPLQFILYIKNRESFLYSLLSVVNTPNPTLFDLNFIIETRPSFQDTVFSILTNKQLDIYLNKIVLEKNKFITI